MLDVFMLLASDFQLRGKHRRPIKIVYVSCWSPPSSPLEVFGSLHYVLIEHSHSQTVSISFAVEATGR
jgi:hypothetical protein